MAKFNLGISRNFEDLFDMKDGGVLSFSRKTLRDFVYDTINIDVDEDYKELSKAKQLRAIINDYDDKVVGKLLTELLIYMEKTNSISIEKKYIFDKCLEASSLMMGEMISQDNQVELDNYIKDSGTDNDKGYMYDTIASSKYFEEHYKSQNNIIDDKSKELSTMEKEKKIFISHASKDKECVKHLVNLLEFIGLNEKTLICTSVTGFGIPNSINIFDYLRNHFQNFELHVIFIHSQNFYNSPMCLNEMGATWVFQTNHTSILLPNFNHNDMKGIVKPDEAYIKLDNDDVKDRLNNLRKDIAKDFNLEQKNDARWEEKRDEFIDKLSNIVSKEANTKEVNINEETIKYDNALEDIIKLLSTSNIYSIRQGMIMKSIDLAGTRITAGNEVLNDLNNPRDTAKWESVFEEVVKKNLIQQSDTKGKIFKITKQGYDLLDKYNS